jgi:hypothetical protein
MWKNMIHKRFLKNLIKIHFIAAFSGLLIQCISFVSQIDSIIISPNGSTYTWQNQVIIFLISIFMNLAFWCIYFKALNPREYYATKERK